MENVEVLERLDKMTSVLVQVLDKMSTLEDQMAVNGKQLLSTREAAKYLGISESRLTHLSMEGSVTYYQSNGRGSKRFYKKTELDECLSKVRIASTDDIARQAATYCALKRK